MQTMGWTTISLVLVALLVPTHAAIMHSAGQDDGQQMVAVYDDAKPPQAPLLLLSQDGTLDEHILKEAERFANLGYSVVAVSLLDDMYTDVTQLQGTANAAVLAGQVTKGSQWMTTCCTVCAHYFKPGTPALVGWELGANAVLAALSYGMDTAAVAFTPNVAPEHLPASFADADEEGAHLFISLDYDQVGHVTALETAMGAGEFSWEMSMLSGTMMGFNTMGDANYNADASMTTMIRAITFLGPAMMKTFEGTDEPDRTIAGLTEMHVNYTLDDGTLPGLLVYDPAQATEASPKPAVVVIPAWGGYTEYEIKRQNYFAQKGYVTMSANIYGLPIGMEVPEPYNNNSGRLSYVSQYRVPGDEMKAQAFVDRIEAAKTAVRNLTVSNDQVALIGFCFGGTGVYNEFRFEGDAQVKVSMHGNMMQTRNFTGVSSANLNGYLLMVAGGNDNGESQTAMVEHLADISKYNSQWELMRFSDVEHGFSEWQSGRYNARAEGRGFEATLDVYAREFSMTRESIGSVPATALTPNFMGEDGSGSSCITVMDGRHDYATCMSACQNQNMTIVCPKTPDEYESIMLRFNRADDGDFWMRNGANASKADGCTRSNNWENNNPDCKINVGTNAPCSDEGKCMCSEDMGTCDVNPAALIPEPFTPGPMCQGGGGGGGGGGQDPPGCVRAGACMLKELPNLPTSCAEVTTMAPAAQACFATCCEGWVEAVAEWKTEGQGALDDCDFGSPPFCTLGIADQNGYTPVAAVAYGSSCYTEEKGGAIVGCVASNPAELGFTSIPALTCDNGNDLERAAATCYMDAGCCSDWPASVAFWNTIPEYASAQCTFGDWCPTDMECEGPTGPCYNPTTCTDSDAMLQCVGLVELEEMTCAALDKVSAAIADCMAKRGCCGGWDESVALWSKIRGLEDCTFPSCAEIANSVELELRLPITDLDDFDEDKQNGVRAALASSTGESIDNIFIRGFELVTVDVRRASHQTQELKVDVEIVTATAEAAAALAASDGLSTASINTALQAQGLPEVTNVVSPVAATEDPIGDTTPAPDSGAGVLGGSMLALAVGAAAALMTLW